jgi:hypothetical protein
MTNSADMFISTRAIQGGCLFLHDSRTLGVARQLLHLLDRSEAAEDQKIAALGSAYRGWRYSRGGI